ncbi:hypothetical protein ACHAPT_003802 [Fusarium lateritium]
MANTLLHETILSVPAAVQDKSPLFTRLPAEVRSNIFSHALTDYPDPSPTRAYSKKTCYTRPTYFAPRKTDTELLRTCRAIYRECWFLPFLLREQVQWLTVQDRAPPEYNVHGGPERLRRTLSTIERQQGEPKVEIQRLRVFAQMWKLEAGDLASLLRRKQLHPRQLTLTIRHADWWRWEDDAPLRFEAKWLKGVAEAMSSSLDVFRIEMETVVRKTDQLSKIVEQMNRMWYFKRPDGAVLFVDPSALETTKWSGNSTWHGKRWVRDESEPHVIEYVVMMVTFRLESYIERNGGSIPPDAKRLADYDHYCQTHMKLHLPDAKPMEHPQPWVADQDASEDRFEIDWLEYLEEDSDEESDIDIRE